MQLTIKSEQPKIQNRGLVQQDLTQSTEAPNPEKNPIFELEAEDAQKFRAEQRWISIWWY